MTIDQIVASLRACGTTLWPPRARGVAALAESRALPASHQAFLALSRGALSQGGYFRLFSFAGDVTGPGPAAVADVNEWNRPETWKFAWPQRVAEYLCFGETAWGDQYAYRYDELRPDRDPPVYFLDAVGMEAEPLAPSFAAFLESEFLRNAERPLYSSIAEARRRVGDLRADEHVVHVPSILISGVEALSDIMKMDAVAAMIINGDLAGQLLDAKLPGEIEALEPYIDQRGRGRMRVRWA